MLHHLWRQVRDSLTWSRQGDDRRPPKQRARCLGRNRLWLRLEQLEARCLPSIFTPTTFADGGLGSGSLRDAILQANADTGTTPDTIQLQAGTYTLTIQNTA